MISMDGWVKVKLTGSEILHVTSESGPSYHFPGSMERLEFFNSRLGPRRGLLRRVGNTQI